MLQVSQGEYDMIHASSPMRPNFEALTVCVHIIYIYIQTHTHTYIRTYIHRRKKLAVVDETSNLLVHEAQYSRDSLEVLWLRVLRVPWA